MCYKLPGNVNWWCDNLGGRLFGLSQYWNCEVCELMAWMRFHPFNCKSIINFYIFRYLEMGKNVFCC